MAQGYKKYTTLRTSEGVYKNFVMPFGLSNGTALFKRYENAILLPLMKYDLCVYFKDILIPLSNLAKNIFSSQKVLEL
jgi:hypothetical protein